MGCIKKLTCGKCDGEGRITVYTESEGHHKVGVWLNDGREYERPTKRVACDACHGSGKVTHEDHDYVETGWSGGGRWYKCRKCGDKYQDYYGN